MIEVRIVREDGSESAHSCSEDDMNSFEVLGEGGKPLLVTVQPMPVAAEGALGRGYQGDA